MACTRSGIPLRYILAGDTNCWATMGSQSKLIGYISEEL
jgi:hypothetical protein